MLIYLQNTEFRVCKILLSFSATDTIIGRAELFLLHFSTVIGESCLLAGPDFLTVTPV
jgi:hypothetical protein